MPPRQARGQPLHPIYALASRPIGSAMPRSYLTYAFSVLGLAANSIPAGLTRDGLPSACSS